MPSAAWLEASEVASNFSCDVVPAPSVVQLQLAGANAAQHGGHEHVEGGRAAVEAAAVEAEGPERPYRRLVEALKTVLLDKGLVSLRSTRAAAAAAKPRVN